MCQCVCVLVLNFIPVLFRLGRDVLAVHCRSLMCRTVACVFFLFLSLSFLNFVYSLSLFSLAALMCKCTALPFQLILYFTHFAYKMENSIKSIRIQIRFRSVRLVVGIHLSLSFPLPLCSARHIFLLFSFLYSIFMVVVSQKCPSQL